MAYNYTQVANPKIADIYNLLKPVTRALPNTTDTYQSNLLNQYAPNRGSGSLVTPPQLPVTPTPAPVNKTSSAPQQPSNVTIPPNWINPNGGMYTPQEVIANMEKAVEAAKNKGSVANYANAAMMNPDQSIQELNRSGYAMNNARNDIATGTTDPYKVGNKSGINYSPSELKAIESAYAGVYDPVLSDVFTKLDAKQKADDRQFEMDKLAKQHEYAMAEKGIGSGGAGAGTYVPGSDPVVDSYVERINRGELASDVFKNIPGVANQNLRNKISQGLMATKYESAKTLGSLDTINKINQLLSNSKLDNISGFVGQTGITSLFGKANTAKVIYNQIAAQLQLQGATLAKGQGAISDYERTIFKDAAVGASRSMGDSEFRQALVNMRSALSLASGLTTDFVVTDMKTGETEKISLDRDGVILAEKNGLMIQAVDDTYQAL